MSSHAVHHAVHRRTITHSLNDPNLWPIAHAACAIGLPFITPFIAERSAGFPTPKRRKLKPSWPRNQRGR